LRFVDHGHLVVGRFKLREIDVGLPGEQRTRLLETFGCRGMTEDLTEKERTQDLPSQITGTAMSLKPTWHQYTCLRPVA